ncbi:MAG: c-type cytochrome [Comamonadaceae bacterium]|nr:MAG: c-type cytochrome [Comamonadaceae bacterium]
MSRTRTIIATTAALAVIGMAGAGAFIWSGLYDVGATRQHLQPVFSVLEVAMHRSVRLRARNIAAPPLEDEAMIRRGAACFHDKCVQCHGAPGVAQGEIGKSMQPLPGPLVDATQSFNARELYWITRHGIRLSGMPAWEFRLTDGEIWDVVAFLQRLPHLTPQAYADMAQWRGTQSAASAASGASGASGAGTIAACGRDINAAPTHSPDVARGRQALYQYACSACHTIPGVTSSSPNVGPPLQGIGGRTLIAGKLANTPANMVRWLRAPQEVKPHTAMPDLSVSREDAADMAAYLATLR